MSSMRLFAAVLPPIEVVEALDEWLAPRREGWRLKWTPPRQWHVTTLFAPEVSSDQLDVLSEGLAEAAAAVDPFRVRLKGGGAFPEFVRARHLIVLLDDPSGGLPRLAEGCRTAARRAGLPIEDRPYQPHLTVARSNVPADLSVWHHALSGTAGDWWLVDRLALVRSMVAPGHRGQAAHQVLETHPLPPVDGATRR